MTSDTLLEQIKKHDGSITKASKRLNLKHRQDLYKYVERYSEGQLDKIPEDVCKYFQKVEMSNGPVSVDEMDLITTLRAKGDLAEESRALSYMIRLAKDEIEDLEEQIKENDLSRFSLRSKPEMDKERVEWIQSLEKDIDKLNQYIEQMTAEQERIEREIISKRFQVSEEESVDEKLKRLVERGGYGGPSWKGKDFGVISICDNGEYMVIVDDIGLDSRDVKLYIYAIIGGKRITIATYDFPNHNETFVRFRLVPKLSYYFEVKSPCVDYPNYTSGILELTNDT